MSAEEIADAVFRSRVVPLYPVDKPLSEMTAYEKGRYKEIISIVYDVLFRINSFPEKIEAKFCDYEEKPCTHTYFDNTNKFIAGEDIDCGQMVAVDDCGYLMRYKPSDL